MTMCDYIFSFDVQARIDKITKIIDDLYILMGNRTASDGVIRYQLNDGQTVIWTTYESIGKITENIKFWENQLVRLKRQVCGSITYNIPGNL
jgi:hypothetical protein